MKIFVCVKQVPDTTGKVAVDEAGTLVRASMATITNPDDMNGIEAALALKDQNPDIKVGVQQDTTGDIYSSSDVTGWGLCDVKEDGTVTTDRVVRYKTGAEAVEALKTDKVDMVIIDNEPAKSFVAANDGIHILEGDNEYAIEDYAICVAKDNKELLDKINTALAELKADLEKRYKERF